MKLLALAVLIILGLILCTSATLLMGGFLLWRFVTWIAHHAMRAL